MKLITIILSIFTSLSSFAASTPLQQAQAKFEKAQAWQYMSTSYYPTPDSDEVSVTAFSAFFDKKAGKDFDFYAKFENEDEFYMDGKYTFANHLKKSVTTYENPKNFDIADTRTVQYSPFTLLQLPWKFVKQEKEKGESFAHYSYLQNTSEFNGKKITTYYHLYLDKNALVVKFERKNYLDGKLNQTVTYTYQNYVFSERSIPIIEKIPSNYSLSYYEQAGIEPLSVGEKIPDFEIPLLESGKISSKNYSGKNVLYLFSSIDCGASATVLDYLTEHQRDFSQDLNLLNIFKNTDIHVLKKYITGKQLSVPNAVGNKTLENEFHINGYPQMYLVDGQGYIKEVLDGYEQIIDYFKQHAAKVKA